MFVNSIFRCSGLARSASIFRGGVPRQPRRGSENQPFRIAGKEAPLEPSHSLSGGES